MAESKKTTKKLTSLKHKVRGAISAYRSTEFVRGKTQHSSLAFRSTMKSIYLDARSDLDHHQYAAFLKWVTESISRQLPELQRIPVGFEELAGVIDDVKVVDLADELVWITERLKSNVKIINHFVTSARQVEVNWINQKHEEAINTLERNDKYCGSSFWSIQLRIALEQCAGGLERQKAYTHHVREKFKQGLLSYIAFYTSVRNEQKSTLNRFHQNVRQRVESNKYYSEDVKSYVLYKLNGQLPVTVPGLADILRIEQSNSICDVYETFLRILQEIAIREDCSDYHEIVLKSTRRLKMIKDPRIQKIMFLLGDTSQFSDLDRRNTEISDALFFGNPAKAISLAIRDLRSQSSVDIWVVIYLACARSFASSRGGTNKSSSVDISWLLGRALTRTDRTPESLSIAEKFALNFSGLPVAAGIAEMVRQLTRVRPDDEYQPWLFGLHSYSFGVEDICFDWHSTKIQEVKSLVGESRKTESLWFLLENRAVEESASRSAIENLFIANGLLRNDCDKQALKTLKAETLTSDPTVLGTLFSSMLLHAYHSAGDRQQVIAHIANIGSMGDSFRQFIPLTTALEEYHWEDYKPCQLQLLSSVALHMLWVANESSSTASLLRFSIRDLFRKGVTDRPSGLYEHKEKYPVHLLVYFLRHVCMPGFIDHVQSLRGSRMLLEERQDICAALRFLDPINADDYAAEIAYITQRKAMDDGQWIVDSTRIHVDIQSLERWATRELSEQFSRYRELRLVESDPEIDIDEIVSELISDPRSFRTGYKPDTEADQLLIYILVSLSDAFLNNSSFGLDFYLSKRIRHQSFIGLIRGPLEFAHLITTKEAETGEYRKNIEWLGKFSGCSARDLEAISDAFIEFADAFDCVLTNAKDNHFQIRTEDKPNGLLYLSISIQIVFLLKELTRQDENLDDFVNTTVEVLWSTLEPSLAYVRKFILEELKEEVALLFDKLRASVKRHVNVNDPAFLQFDVAIGQCATDVQKEVDVASQWFTRSSEDNDGMQTFDLAQMLNIAIDSTLKSQRIFEPSIETEVIDQNIPMATSNLVFVHDVLFVALDNVRAHSNIKKPKIRVLAEVNLEEATFKLAVSSQMRAHNKENVELKLKEIRKLIDENKFERRTRKEGGSGLLKLAADTLNTSRGTIDFGIRENGEFELTVVNSLIVASLPQSSAL